MIFQDKGSNLVGTFRSQGRWVLRTLSSARICVFKWSNQ